MASVARNAEIPVASGPPYETSVLRVNPSTFGHITFQHPSASFLEAWDVQLAEKSQDADHIRRAAHELQTSDVPVAFPTETVYGLAADATRSPAVQGIYRAKARPSDNPLIVHVASLSQLRGLLRPLRHSRQSLFNDTAHVSQQNGVSGITKSNLDNEADPIPAIYKPLIHKFWPGPLTLIMPNPANSLLAPEVTAGLQTFGVRMPSNLLALVLIKLANLPIAAPSANASTKPSPTKAEHVKHDLDGRIKTIIDGGPCTVGVESTVVDGLSSTPLILRPGGIGIDELRRCPGWENVAVGYKDISEAGLQPKAPGMKYKHYSPKATVVLCESRSSMPNQEGLLQLLGKNKSLGIIRTRTWPSARLLDVLGLKNRTTEEEHRNGSPEITNTSDESTCNGTASLPEIQVSADSFDIRLSAKMTATIWEVSLGANVDNIARGLFSGLRELDQHDVDAILVEGIDDDSGDVAAAIMNRLRKAAEIKVQWLE